MHYKTRLGGTITTRLNFLARRLEGLGFQDEVQELLDLVVAVNEYRKTDGEYLAHKLNRDLQAAVGLLREGQVEEAAALLWSAALSIYAFGKEGEEGGE